MNDKEQELEMKFNRVKDYPSFRPIPVFELFISTFSISITLILFWIPGFMHQNTAVGGENLYSMLLEVMPQYMWAFVFAAAALLKAFGMLLEWNAMRYTGIVISILLYAIIAYMFIVMAPNIGMIQFTCMAVYSIVSLVNVKHTSIRTRKERQDQF